MALIEVRNISKNYRLEKAEAPALHQVSLDIEAQERICLMGPSGSGKSTLLNLLGGIDTADSGTVHVDGVAILELKDKAMSLFRNQTLGFVFQSFNLIPVLTVFENVEYPLLMQKLGKGERRDRVHQVLESVGLLSFAKRGSEQLSGGQRQRVAIARALVHRPKLVLADEPTAALDHKTGAGIMELLVSMNREEGTTLVFSSHDPAVSKHADRIVQLADGQIL